MRRVRTIFQILLAVTPACCWAASNGAGCGATGAALADQLWQHRLVRLEANRDAQRTLEKPTALKTYFLDRMSAEVSYGDEGTLTVGERRNSYTFTQGERSSSFSIKYSLPFGVFARTTEDARAARNQAADFANKEMRVTFNDLIYDLRLALAERDLLEESTASAAQHAIATLKVEKLAERLRHLTETPFSYECIR